MGEVLSKTVAQGRAFMNIIGGKQVEALSGKRMDVVSPSDGIAFGSIPASGTQDVDAAVKSARHAYEHGEWGKMAAVDRGRILLKLSELISKNSDELAALESRDTVNRSNRALPILSVARVILNFTAGLLIKSTVTQFRLLATFLRSPCASPTEWLQGLFRGITQPKF